MDSFWSRPSSSKQASLRDDEFINEISDSDRSILKRRSDDFLADKDANRAGHNWADHTYLHPQTDLDSVEWNRIPPHHLPALDQSGSRTKSKKNKSKIKANQTSPENKTNKTKPSTLSTGEYHPQSEDHRTDLETSKLIRHEANTFLQSDQPKSYCDVRKRDQEWAIQGNIQNSLATDVDGVFLENTYRHRDYGRRRRYKPASIVSGGIEQGAKIPMPPNRVHLDVAQSCSTNWNNFESGCNNTHTAGKTDNEETGTNGRGRRRKINLVAVVYLQAARANAEVEMPLPTGRMKSSIFPSNSASCNEFQEEHYESRYIHNHEKEGRYDGHKGSCSVGRQSRLSPASGVPCETEQLYLPLPPANYCVRGARTRPSGSTQRKAVCSGAENADVLKERTRARVLMKRFGDLDICNSETSNK